MFQSVCPKQAFRLSGSSKMENPCRQPSVCRGQRYTKSGTEANDRFRFNILFSNPLQWTHLTRPSTYFCQRRPFAIKKHPVLHPRVQNRATILPNINLQKIPDQEIRLPGAKHPPAASHHQCREASSNQSPLTLITCSITSRTQPSPPFLPEM